MRLRSVSDLVGRLRSAARDAVGRIRTHLPGVLGRRSASTAVESAVEDVARASRRTDRNAAGAMTRQSTRRRSSATLENPARFVDPDDEEPRTAPFEALPDRERPLSEPGEERRNGTRTELTSTDGDRTRIADPDNPEAYVESDASVVLDHVR